jgi:hypothetical protein
MKAHEVRLRLLCRCPVCGKLGDQGAIVKVGPMKTPAHDRCAFGQLGLGVAKFTLAGGRNGPYRLGLAHQQGGDDETQ